MARKTRIHYPGALYHVMLRGNARQTVFHQDVECRYFEDILAQGLEQYALVLHAYCWMKNHVHMALQVREEPLTKLMQNISQRYTYWFNKRHDLVGHVFQGRYKAVLSRKNETVQVQIGIETLVELVARVYQVSPREMTSASRARHLAQARAMATLIGMDHCGYLISDVARYFKRDMPALSRQVKALRARLEKNIALQEKAACIQDQITTIKQA